MLEYLFIPSTENWFIVTAVMSTSTAASIEPLTVNTSGGMITGCLLMSAILLTSKARLKVGAHQISKRNLNGESFTRENIPIDIHAKKVSAGTVRDAGSWSTAG